MKLARLRFPRLATLALALAAAAFAAAPALATVDTTTSTAVSSSAWTDFGAGPLAVFGNSGTATCVTADVAPTDPTLVGPIVTTGSFYAIRTRNHVWCRAALAGAGVPVTSLSAVPDTTLSGSSGSGGTAADQSGSNAADAQPTSSANQHALDFPLLYNGSTYDRWYGTIAGGARVAVTNLPSAWTQGAPAAIGNAWPIYLALNGGVVSPSNPLPANEAQIAGVAVSMGAGATDGGTQRVSGNQGLPTAAANAWPFYLTGLGTTSTTPLYEQTVGPSMQAPGTAGTVARTVQGCSTCLPVPVSGTITATQGAAGNAAWKVDGSGVTQPVAPAGAKMYTLAASSVGALIGTGSDQATGGISTANFTTVNVVIVIPAGVNATMVYEIAQDNGTYVLQSGVSTGSIGTTAALASSDVVGGNGVISRIFPGGAGYFRIRLSAYSGTGTITAYVTTGYGTAPQTVTYANLANAATMATLANQYRATAYTDTQTALVASGTVTNASHATGIAQGSGGIYAYYTAVAFADQAGTLYVEGSLDNFASGASTIPMNGNSGTAVSANVTATFKGPVTLPYMRTRFTNGATAQTKFSLTSAFSGS